MDQASRLKKELELQTKLEFTLREKIEKLDEIKPSDETAEQDIKLDAPEMPQNVLGLDRADIMQRVMRNIQKSQGLHRKTSENSTNIGLLANEINQEPISYPSMRVQRDAFRDFLNKRLTMRQKMQKEDRNDRPDLDYFEEEWRNKRENELKKYDFYEYLADEKDYIEENDEINEK